MIKMVGTLLRRIHSSFATNVLDVPPRLLAFLLFLLLLFLPVAKPARVYLGIVIIAFIYAIFATSWDLLVGRSGQVSLGHALFFGIGAYLSAFLSRFYGLPIWVTIPVCMLLCASVAVLLGFPSLRVKGPYLTLVTMAFPLILSVVLFSLPTPFGGEGGIAHIPSLFPSEFFTERGFSLSGALYAQRVVEYYLVLFLLLVSSIVLYKVANSKTGIVLVSILDDESASKACGINVTKYKLLAWAISALFAGLAGGLFAHYVGSAAPTNVLGLTTSFFPVIMTILGGIGTIYGPIVGAFTVQSLMEVAGEVFKRFGAEELSTILYVGIIIFFIVKWPTGIAKSIVEKLDELTEERELDERKKKK